MSKARGLADLGNVYNDGALSNRSLITNGAMTVAQRGVSVAGITTSGYHTIDRFKIGEASSGTWAMSQSTDAPSGFAYSLRCECTSASASPSNNNEMRVGQVIEAQDLQHLNYGTADAKEITASFWVKSNKTGSVAMWLYQGDSNRSASPSFTIDSAGTWEYKSITIPKDVSGVINNDSGAGLELAWYLSSGANFIGSTSNTWVAAHSPRVKSGDINFADTVGNYFQVTGVQLEVGDTATPFEHRSYGDELAKCQRFYYRTVDDSTTGLSDSHLIGHVATTAQCRVNEPFPVTMRTIPSCTVLTSAILVSGGTSFAVGYGDSRINALGTGHYQYTKASTSGVYDGLYIRAEFDAEL